VAGAMVGVGTVMGFDFRLGAAGDGCGSPPPGEVR
jgi:hypothetical protein